MAKLGRDCQIILDGHGYFVEPGSYQMHRRRNYSVVSTPGVPTGATGGLTGTADVETDTTGKGATQVIFTTPFHEIPAVALEPQILAQLGTAKLTPANITAEAFVVDVGAGAEAEQTHSAMVTTDGSGNGSATVTYDEPFTNPPAVSITNIPPGATATETAKTVTGFTLHLHHAAAHDATIFLTWKAIPTIKIDWTATPVQPPTDPSLPPPELQASGTPQRITDRGPYMRTWTFDALCFNTLKRYDGSDVGNAGQRLRDQLQRSYDKVATTLGFTDPSGTYFHVVFADLSESIADLRTQRLGIPYRVKVTLIENDPTS